MIPGAGLLLAPDSSAPVATFNRARYSRDMSKRGGKMKQLSDMEVLLQLARESMARYGTALPPLGESAPKRKAAEESKPVKIDWSKEIHTCPKCGFRGAVDPHFGWREVRGIERKQSWCHTCRAKTSYYDKPRKAKRQP